jgi:hypothetical protein
MNLTEIDLGEEGKEYVSSCLRQGTGLCLKILRGLDRGGDVFAPLPAATPLKRARQFEVGGLMSRSETGAWFERHVEQLSGRTGNGTLVFQDVWATPRDFPAPCDGMFVDSSNVYYALGPHEITAATISSTMRRITSFLFVSVFCDFSFRTEDMPPRPIVGETITDEIANNALEVFISAYDQEGLVVWVRKD